MYINRHYGALFDIFVLFLSNVGNANQRHWKSWYQLQLVTRKALRLDVSTVENVVVGCEWKNT